MEPKQDMAYIGINNDGLTVAVVFDDPNTPKDTAKTVAEWIRMGRTIERVTAENGCARLKQDWPRVRELRASQQAT